MNISPKSSQTSTASSITPLIFWHMHRLPRYAGILGLAGLALLAFAAVLYTQDLRPYQQDLERQDQELARKFSQLRTPPAASSVAAELAKLNKDDTFTFFLRRMNQIASQTQVGMSQMDYKSQLEADNKLKRYSMQFPVSARYMQLRRFLIALEAIPGVRIENLNLQRQLISDEQVSIQVQLSYLTEVR